MARQREFDPDEALDKAMLLFWRKGYDETSVRDPVEFAAVAQAGLYGAFGDKHRLYEAALDRFFQTVPAPLPAELAAPGGGPFKADAEGLRLCRFV